MVWSSHTANGGVEVQSLALLALEGEGSTLSLVSTASSVVDGSTLTVPLAVSSSASELSSGLAIVSLYPRLVALLAIRVLPSTEAVLPTSVLPPIELVSR